MSPEFIIGNELIQFVDYYKYCVVKNMQTPFSALPIFVQYGERERQLYFGVCQNNSMRTNFESVHQRRGHPLKCHLSGCLDIFRETLVYFVIYSLFS